jgi:two-component system sensor histidine kinase RegB
MNRMIVRSGQPAEFHQTEFQRAKADVDAYSATVVVHGLAMPWIVRLRYGMIAGEIAVIAAIFFGLRVSMPFAVLATLISIQILSNWSLNRWRQQLRRNTEHVVGVLFCVDTLCLTVILAFTGGPANPFSLLYLVQITFSAVILHKAWTWALGALATLSFGLLFWISRSVPALQEHVQPGQFSLHLFGMWLAFATAALLISFFIATVSAEARRKELELLAMQRRLARNERLASLVTLAAGAAHEIATPLSTIAVTAKEIQHDSARGVSGKQIEEDAVLIRSQVERCREILERMGAQGADPLGEAPKAMDVGDLFARVEARFPAERERIQIEISRNLPTCVLPQNAAVEALSALVKNALDASQNNEPIRLQVQADGDSIRFLIHDQGIGMSPEVLERVLEPFFTTKPAGKGMGLGAFLAHLFAQRLGGNLSFQSKPGEGCTAIMELPIAIHVQR